MSVQTNAEDTDLAWWLAQLEDRPVRVELPTGAGESATAALACDADTVLCSVVGLVGRYCAATSPGGAVVAVGVDGTWRPVALDISGNPTVHEVRERIARAYDAAADHQVDFDRILATSEAVRQVAVHLDDTPWVWDRPALGVHWEPGGIRVEADHAAEVVVGHLGVLVTEWRASRRLFEVELLSDAERGDLLRGAWGPRTDAPDRTVWDHVLAAATRTPDAVAVIDDDRRVTYAELVTSAERLAGILGAAGAGPHTLVGLAVSRSAQMIVGLLAIMRSGAAYVPIDAAYPPDRIDMMVEDADLEIVIVDRESCDAPAFRALTRLRVDVAPAPLVPAAPSGGPTPDDLAYVIFTSGSTGRPKGVAIGHRALANFVATMAEEPGMTAADHLLAVTTLSFDIAALELFVPLCVGGCVVVPGRETLLDPDLLAARIEAESITVMQATPATWRMLVDAGWAGRRELRALCGGEALPAALADALVERCAQLWNMYGPTETTIWSLIDRVHPGEPITIGRPIGNTAVFVVGTELELLPRGVPGELLIGGLGLADCYLGDPDRTAAKFVPDQITGAGESRLYRTGDLVRLRTDGRLEFISRIDSQVKVRGFRIELAEVEAALDRHPAVARSVAIVRPDPRTSVNSLLAYAVLRPGESVEQRELRAFISSRLPEYMQPSAVGVLERFPLTLNGKVDRAAMPAIAPDVTSNPREPGTALEQRIAAIWRRVLELDSVGMHDSVFDLGVDSLRTARLYAEVRRELKLDLPVAAAFSAPTIAALASMIAAKSDLAPMSGSLVTIRESGARTPLFLVHGGAGTVLLFEPLARRLGAEQPVYAFQAQGLYGDEAPQGSVPAMARTYVELMRSVQPHGPYRVGGYCFGALVAFEMGRQLEGVGERVELLVTFNGPSPSYLRRYRPRFDRLGAVTDERGKRLRGGFSVSAHVRTAWARNDRLAPFAKDAIAGPLWRARRALRRRRRDLALLAIVLRKRPLPDRLREADAFQRISELAQYRYRARRWHGTMLVVRADGLYHRDDLGWADHVEGAVCIVHVAGEQLKPRDTMTDDWVEPIVVGVRAEIGRLDGE